MKYEQIIFYAQLHSTHRHTHTHNTLGEFTREYIMKFNTFYQHSSL